MVANENCPHCGEPITDPERGDCKKCGLEVDAPAGPMQYTVTVSEPARNTKVSGCGCGWSGTYAEVADIEECALTPGDPSPAGRCPECNFLVYVEGTK